MCKSFWLELYVDVHHMQYIVTADVSMWWYVPVGACLHVVCSLRDLKSVAVRDGQSVVLEQLNLKRMERTARARELSYL